MASSQSHNPYIGPRPFEREEKNLFFGREREISELQSLLTAHRTLLLYAASGAGKTSLLNAGLLPLMEQEGFEVLPVARVRGLIPKGVRPENISNLYVFNTLMNWTEDEADHKTLTRMSLAEFLKTREHILYSEGFSAPRLIIFDQFEELFTLYQQYWKQREDFFHQVAEALEQDPVLRVLFVMREDYLARLDPYVSMLPERLRARYRLVRLRFEDACQAVKGPLKGSKRSFADGVAERLVGELLKTKVQSVTGETIEAVGEYVEPVQLQIVCQNLWDSLPADVTLITSEHLRFFGDVDEALKGFYENAVKKTISETNVKEETLRKWFARELITPAGTRGTVYRDREDTAGIPNAAVDILEDEHILRGEQRAGAHWYELTHDRMIEPIRNSNEIWLPKLEVEQARLHTRKKLRKYLSVGVSVVLVLIAALTILSFKKAEQAKKARAREKEARAQAEEAQNIIRVQQESEMNLALQEGAKASQSATAYGGVPKRAIDGNLDGHFFHGSVTHTDNRPDSWWQVELPSTAIIEEIVIWNRSDCCEIRLSNFVVSILDDSLNKVWEDYFGGPVGRSKLFKPVTPVPGQFVKVQIPGKNIEGNGYLSLAEVQVFGHSVINLARQEGAKASQSTLAYGGVPERAIDGNLDGDYSHGSVTCTDNKPDSWWQVELPSTAIIEGIVIWNRSDCCGSRLSNFLISILDDSSNPVWEDYYEGPVGRSKLFKPVTPVRGRFVKVQILAFNKDKNGYLSLAEVQVFGEFTE